jgi:hypothetical protein
MARPVRTSAERRHFQHVRAFAPFRKLGDESAYRAILKTSRMRWGKNRKEVDAGILRLLREGLKKEA